jgi:hypothetical protein
MELAPSTIIFYLETGNALRDKHIVFDYEGITLKNTSTAYQLKSENSLTLRCEQGDLQLYPVDGNINIFERAVYNFHELRRGNGSETIVKILPDPYSGTNFGNDWFLNMPNHRFQIGENLTGMYSNALTIPRINHPTSARASMVFDKYTVGQGGNLGSESFFFFDGKHGIQPIVYIDSGLYFYNSHMTFVNPTDYSLKIQSGNNSSMGLATLSAGTATVNNTLVTNNSRIFLTSQEDGGTPGWLRVSSRVANTSFTITSSSNTDTSKVAWWIVEQV